MNKELFMFVVEDALHVPGTDIISIIGNKSNTPIRAGTVISDGKNSYIVASIPFVRNGTLGETGKTCITIKADHYSADDLKGKTLSIAQ